MTRNEAQTIATRNALAFRKALTEHLFRGGPCPDNDPRYGHHHGWFLVHDVTTECGSHSFNQEMLFPNEHHPRFPADQGLSD